MLKIYAVTWSEIDPPCYEDDPHLRLSIHHTPILSSSPESAIRYCQELYGDRILNITDSKTTLRHGELL
jgi:hypothetical protein